MEISFCFFFLPPAFALANLCITSAVDVLEIAQRGLPVTWTRELYLSVFPQLAVFLCHSPLALLSSFSFSGGDGGAAAAAPSYPFGERR